ncbi:tRNA preQ1(34) S-adenosylmethionine ribosyltransferase-isomerase QueA [Nitrosomonas aestuarii]|uniref:tRNA preQ1(34) S-adenosylmethionine ribosyltransferase-isomerase QueA n=1 Tax=Nitrosomonas aestuarii TaxID=52441 RepID=UPI000D31D2DD|nr:tRNA preQ1(34) S-adenosylmethionine ribosyltransferase-isomerase QueA [Nitrosomonas aestuarii]PTN13190.1 S-adenosylmethionine:tRNA ribosyltransferase-isomerase [Nitrosomonas aestuarii]
MKTQDFDFDLPPALIAKYPAEQRTSSRLLYLDSTQNRLHDAQFLNLPDYLRPGDVMVFNDTRVIKARLLGQKESGGKIEVMIERILDEHRVQASIRASHAPKSGSKLLLANHISTIVSERKDSFYTLCFEHEKSIYELLEYYGQLPLPPYIDRAVSAADESRYQTVYAKNAGAVAAPTAGLHFDDDLLAQLKIMGVVIVYVTLHVGAGTFQPVRVDNIADHTMHSELFHIPEETVRTIEQAKKTGNRIMAVGTTSLRALEASATQHQGKLVAGLSETSIFITPGYRFQIAERLLTNFHLPRSTLLMLVSAFGGMENIRTAYHHAIANKYRFFSYGDAMLIERKS